MEPFVDGLVSFLKGGLFFMVALTLVSLLPYWLGKAWQAWVAEMEKARGKPWLPFLRTVFLSLILGAFHVPVTMFLWQAQPTPKLLLFAMVLVWIFGVAQFKSGRQSILPWRRCT